MNDELTQSLSRQPGSKIDLLLQSMIDRLLADLDRAARGIAHASASRSERDEYARDVRNRLQACTDPRDALLISAVMLVDPALATEASTAHAFVAALLLLLLGRAVVGERDSFDNKFERSALVSLSLRRLESAGEGSAEFAKVVDDIRAMVTQVVRS